MLHARTVGIAHVQPSFHPIVWLSRRTEAALAVRGDASLRTISANVYLYILRLSCA